MSPNKLRRSFISTACLVGLLAFASASTLHATALTWSGTTNGNWSVGGAGGNWSGAAAPVALDSLTFTGTTNTTTSNDLASNIVIAGITFDNTSTGGAFTLAGPTAITLGGNITTTGSTGTPTHLISLGMTLNASSRTVTTATGNNVNITGVIGEDVVNRSLVKAGSGTLSLSGANTFSGPLRVNLGTLNITTLADSGSSAAGIGTVIQFGNGTTNGGVLNYTGGGVTTARSLEFLASTIGPATINCNGSNGGSGLIITGTVTNSGTDLVNAKPFTLGGSNTDANAITNVIGNGNGIISLTKADAGRWTLSGANTYTGATTVSGGVLQLGNASALPGGIDTAVGAGESALILSDGVLGLGAGNFTRALAPTVASAPGQVAWGNLKAGGFAAYGANRSVNLGGASAGVTWNSAGPFGGLGLILGRPTATHTVDFQNPIDLGGINRTVQVNDGAAAVDGILSGAITNGQLTKTGAGTLQLTSSGNTFNGNVTINNGTLQLGGSGTLASQNVRIISDGAGQTASFDLNNINLTIGALTLGGIGGTPTSTNSVQTGTGTLTLGGNITSDALGDPLGSSISGKVDLGGTSRTISVSDSVTVINDLTISAAISGTGAIFKTGPGTVVLSGANSYTLATQPRGGTIKLGANDTLPVGNPLAFFHRSADTSAAVDLAGFTQTIGSLQLSDNASSNSAGFTASIIDSVGGGVLKLGGAVTYNNGGAGFENGAATVSAKLDLNGATRSFSIEDSPVAQEVVISGVIQDSVGGAGLTKDSTGVLVLSVVNTYTGSTTVNGGTLQINNAYLANASTVNIASTGATLALNFVGSDTVDKLFIGGVQQAAGVYEAVGNPGGGIEIAQITGTGTLTVTSSPGSSPYNTWAAGSFAHPFTNTAPSVDFDNDGMTNLLEFVLGGDPTISQSGITPTVTASGSNMVVTFKRSDISVQSPTTSVTVQVSDDLASWPVGNNIPIGTTTNAGPIGATGASYTVTDGGALDTIVVTIPKGVATKRFARIIAVQP